jgi:glycosyl transferase family 87
MEMPVAARIERVVCPFPGIQEARAISILSLIAAGIMCALSLYYGYRGETFMGRPLGADFVQFYAAGKILNDGPPAGIYDIPRMAKVELDSLPSMPKTQMLVFANAPYVVIPFRMLAKLPYFTAYCVWLAFSLALYAASVWILFRNLLPGRLGGAAFLLALSAPMYTLETWIGGQVAIYAFLAVVLFVRCLLDGRPLLAGMALGLAVYKPSLVALPAAMMLVGGAWKMLAGLCASTTMVGLVSVAMVGWNGCVQWILTLRVYSYLATAADSVLRRTKYVDFNSFFLILFGGNRGATMAAAAVGVTAFASLAWAWWKWGKRGAVAQRCLWAATLTFTLVINLYVPVYDTIVLAPAVALLPGILPSLPDRKRVALQGWVAVLWLAPWLTQSWADFLRFQLLTVVLASFGWWTLRLLHEEKA